MNQYEEISQPVLDQNGYPNVVLLRYLLQKYVDSDSPWTVDPNGEPLTGERLLAIWEDNKDDLMKDIYLKTSSTDFNLKLSEHNSYSTFVPSDDLDEEDWDILLLLMTQKEEIDWDEVLEHLGNDPEDIEFIEMVRENPEYFKELVREVFDDEMTNEIAAFSSGMIRTSQEQVVDVERLKQEIQGGEDLNSTQYGPIDESAYLQNHLPSDIVSEAIADANQVVKVDDKEILTMEGGPLGVAETDLTRKIIKRRMLDQIENSKNPDGTISQQIAEEIKNSIWEVDKGKNLVAFRVNPERIMQEVQSLISEVRENINNGADVPENVSESQIEKLTLTLAVASVIAHEGQHALNMTVEQGDPSGEGDAETAEAKFLDMMLEGNDKYAPLRGLITREGKESSEGSQISQSIETASSRKWGYKI